MIACCGSGVAIGLLFGLLVAFSTTGSTDLFAAHVFLCEYLKLLGVIILLQSGHSTSS